MESIELAIPVIIGLVLITLGFLIFNSKGLILIAGYNTLSEEEKEKIDKKKLGNKTGIFLILIGTLTVILGISLKYLSGYSTYISIIFVLIVIIQSIILIYSVNKKK